MGLGVGSAISYPRPRPLQKGRGKREGRRGGAFPTTSLSPPTSNPPVGGGGDVGRLGPCVMKKKLFRRCCHVGHKE